MSHILEYDNWEDLDKINEDVIDAIDAETRYDEDLANGKIRITVEYVGPSWWDGPLPEVKAHIVLD